MLKHILILILFSLILSSCYDENSYSHRIEKKEILKYPEQNLGLTFIDDLNNNSHSELVIVFTDPQKPKQFNYKIQTVDLFSDFHLDSENIWDELKDVGAHDFNNDGRKEIIYIHERNDSLFLKAYNLFGNRIKGKEYLLNNYFLSVKKKKDDEYWQGGCKLAKFKDLNYDGFDDVLIVMHATYEELPRGVIAYDVHNKETLWYYPTGTVIHQINLIDLNKDGITEIVLNTATAGNGAYANGTDDFHSYFLVLDGNGKLVFKEEMAGENSGTIIKYDYFTSRIKKDLVTLTSSDNYNENGSQLIIWDWDKDLNFFQQKPNSELSLNRNFEILSYNGSPHIFAITRAQKICVIDPNLTVVDTLYRDSNFTKFRSKFDLDFDGQIEYLWNLRGGKTAILNSNFKIIALTELRGYIFKIKKGRNQKDKYAIVGNNGTISELILKKNPITFRFLTKPWEKIIAALVIANLIFIFFLYYKTGNWKWYRDQLKYFENSAFAVFVLGNKGNVITSNKKGEKLLRLTQNEIINNFAPNLFEQYFYEISCWIKKCLNERQNSKSTFKINSNKIEHTLDVQLQFILSRLGRKEGSLLIINDITPILQSKRTAAWLSIAQKLAHEIKNPLTTIRLSLQRIQMEYENNPVLKQNLEELVEDSLIEATRVRKVVDDFMRFSKTETDNPCSINIEEFIQDIVNKYLLLLPDEIEIKTEIKKSLPVISAVESQIYSAISNLMDNAFESIYEKGEILIKVGIAEILENKSYLGIKEFVVVEISDTGIGMDKSVLDKIFQPFYTTKEGGSGLGLIIVKKIIEDHGGTIDIFSKKNLGTNVTIKLPINNNSKNKSI